MPVSATAGSWQGTTWRPGPPVSCAIKMGYAHDRRRAQRDGGVMSGLVGWELIGRERAWRGIRQKQAASAEKTPGVRYCCCCGCVAVSASPGSCWVWCRPADWELGNLGSLNQTGARVGQQRGRRGPPLGCLLDGLRPGCSLACVVICLGLGVLGLSGVVDRMDGRVSGRGLEVEKKKSQSRSNLARCRRWCWCCCWLLRLY